MENVLNVVEVVVEEMEAKGGCNLGALVYQRYKEAHNEKSHSVRGTLIDT